MLSFYHLPQPFISYIPPIRKNIYIPKAWPNPNKKQKNQKNQKIPTNLKPPLYISPLSSTTPSGSSSALATAPHPGIMSSGGEKIGEFIFNLIFDLAWIKRAAMMMMMMSVVVFRIVSIRKTAAALVFMTKVFWGQRVSTFLGGRVGGGNSTSSVYGDK